MFSIKHTIITSVALLCCLALSGQDRITRAEYIEHYKKYAIEDMEVYGIPASIKMAQALLESDDGNSVLARRANNHFGIKCKKDWTGETMRYDDDAPQECFRKYATAEDSYKDHAEFLDKSPRYQSLFELAQTDYKGWAYGLKAAGYATNPKYPELLIKIIEDNRLYLLDEGKDLTDVTATPADSTTAKADTVATVESVDVDNYVLALYSKGGYNIYLNNGCEFVVANPGDSIENMAKSLSIPSNRLRRMNDLSKSDKIGDGDMVYIKTKNRRSINGHLLHTVKAGETLHGISQRYGIRCRSLATLNHTTPESAIFEGQQLKLR